MGERGSVFAINTSSVDNAPDHSYVTPIDQILDAVITDVSFGPEVDPRVFTVRELAELGHIPFNPPFPKRG